MGAVSSIIGDFNERRENLKGGLPPQAAANEGLKRHSGVAAIYGNRAPPLCVHISSIWT